MKKDTWKAKQYLKFSEERTRPALDLLNRINLSSPKIIYDLGCGPGNSTELLKQRWPEANIIGVDNSTDMLAEARNRLPNLQWVTADLNEWQAEQKADLIFSNATFQWLNHHDYLFPKLLNMLQPQGILALQMPRNFQSIPHQLIIEVVQNNKFCKKLQSLLRYGLGDQDPVSPPVFYYDLLAPLTKKLDIWETDYLQVLEGENPVLEWMKGTGLRPMLTALTDPEKIEFLEIYGQLVKKKFPSQADGKTLLPYKRLFIVAQRIG